MAIINLLGFYSLLGMIFKYDFFSLSIIIFNNISFDSTTIEIIRHASTGYTGYLRFSPCPVYRLPGASVMWVDCLLSKMEAVSLVNIAYL